MSDNNETVYEAPKSDLTVNSGNSQAYEVIPRFTAWAVFGLSVITLGIYQVYWLFSRAKLANLFAENKINMNVLYLFVAAFILNFLTSFGSEFLTMSAEGPEDPVVMAVASISLISSLAYLVFYFYVLFALRNRLQDAFNKPMSGILTFFLSVIYLQYKSNQAIDEKQG